MLRRDVLRWLASLLAVDLSSGFVASQQQLLWQGSTRPDLLTCMA
jgi:hypothetical protein